MLWGTSSLALYIPWAGSNGPYLGISLWLWLGVLDAVQGVGLGMILLQVCSLTVRRGEAKLMWDAIDTLASARLRNLGVRAGHRIHLRHDRTRHCTKLCWSWVCFPRRSKMGLRRRTLRQSDGPPSLLDCFDLPAGHCSRVLLVLPQGTIGYVAHLNPDLLSDPDLSASSASINPVSDV